MKSGEDQRPDGRYQFRYTDPKTGQRITIYSNDLAELRRKEREIQRDIDDDIRTVSAAKKADLNTVYEQYLSLRIIEDSTRINYNSTWNNHVRNSLGKMKVVNIRPSHIKSFYAEMTKKGYAWSTLKIIHSILCPVFNMAVEDDIIRKNPASGNLTGYGSKPKEKQALSIEQQQKLLDFAYNSDCYGKHFPLLQVMIGTACRIGEISGLTWSDIDFDKREVFIIHQLIYKNLGTGCKFHLRNPKSEAGIRIIPMSQKVFEALKEQRKQQFLMGINKSVQVEGLSDFVFTSKNGKPLAPNAVNSILKSIVSAYNKREHELARKEKRTEVPLPPISAHTLRHTGCTRMAEAGMDPKVLQYIMGHSDIGITMGVYNHLTGREQIIKEMEKIDELSA